MGRRTNSDEILDGSAGQEDEGPSKSARKRAATAAQKLGERLVGLREADLAKLPLPERLLDAIRAARSIRSHGGLARQRQYIGKLMREVDPEALLELLEAGSRTQAVDAERSCRVEAWRDRLIDEGDTAVTTDSLPDLLQPTREVSGDDVVYCFANGLQIKTEIFTKNDRLRILPLGSPQGSLMNHMIHFPETVRDRHVFEPFAGSGALGFMALKLGAARIDFLDINPRAAGFHSYNAALNNFPASRVASIQGDIAEFAALRKYDLILANPPFVPTPDGIDGTLTSNGGPEGNRFVEILLTRLEELLEPGGRALIYVMQFAKDGEPLIVDLLAKTVRRRPVEITPTQLRHVPFATYCTAYLRLFAAAESAIEGWRSAMVRTHGHGLTLCHYIVDIGPQSPSSAGCVMRDNFAEKFGASFRVPSENEDELAFARVMENFVA